MEHRKMRLCTAAFMLFLSGVMLGSMSYAWLTMSTNPEVVNIVASVSANQNLEIALDDGYQTMADVDNASSDGNGVQGSTAGDPYTWGNYVDLTKAFRQQSVTLQQVKFSSNQGIVLEYPRYDVDGRVQSLGTLQSMTVSDYDGKGKNGGVKFYAAKPGESTNYAYSVTYWMRTNVTGEVSLSEAAKRANDGTDTTTGVNGIVGKGSYVSIPLAGNGTADVLDRFMSNMRVVFVDETMNPTLLFEASIGEGVSDGTVRKYNLVTMAANAGANPIYKSEVNGAPIALTANQAKKITMYVYMDGEDIMNSQALLYDVTGVEINVQFDNSALEDTMQGGAMTGDTTQNSVYTNGVTN